MISDVTWIENLTRFSTLLRVCVWDLMEKLIEVFDLLVSVSLLYLSDIYSIGVDNLIHICRPWVVTENLSGYDSFAVSIQNLMHKYQASFAQVSFSVLG